MKNIIVITYTLAFLGLFLTVNPALAEDRVKVYEMAESGIAVEFPVQTPDRVVPDAITEKIIAEDLKI